MKKTVLTLLLSALAAGVAQATAFQSVVADKSQITFSYRQMGVGMEGRFRKFSAQIQIDSRKPQQAKGSIEIDLGSIDTGSSEADQEVVGKSWFHVAAHPRASFVLKSLKPVAPQQYEAVGALSLKGQTREVVAPVSLSPQGVLSGQFVIRRADYAIGEGMWSKFDVVANEVAVKFSFTLK